MSKQSKPQLSIKIGAIRLTEHEKEVIALGMDTEFFKIITTKILPKRLVQLAMTSLAGSQTVDDVQMFRGRYAEATWLKDFMEQSTKNIDTDDGDPDEEQLKSKATTRSRQT